MTSLTRRGDASPDSGRVSNEGNDPDSVSFTETGPIHHGTYRIAGETIRTRIGDIVLARKDLGTSYHLAVVVDDSSQGVTEVVRGEDLFEATFVHTLLQDLLTLPRPKYFHHSLIRDERGRRLAKRDDARSLARFRADGLAPKDIRHMVSQSMGSEPGGCGGTPANAK